MINQDTVKYISSLARLHLEADQIDKTRHELEAILDYVQTLNELDVSGIKPTSHVLDLENVFRSDMLKPSLSQEEALAFSVDHLNGCFKVPKVIE